DRQLLRGDDAFGLVADVEEDLVAVDLDHLALDEVAVLEFLEALLDGADQLLGSEVVLGHRSFSSAVDCQPLLSPGWKPHPPSGQPSDKEGAWSRRCRRGAEQCIGVPIHPSIVNASLWAGIQ